MSNAIVTKVTERNDQTIYRVKGLLAFNQLDEAVKSELFPQRKATKRMELWFNKDVYNVLKKMNMNLPQNTVEHEGKTLHKMNFNSNPNETKDVPANHIAVFDEKGTPLPPSLINTISRGSKVEVQFIIGPNPNNPAKTLTHLQCVKVLDWVKYDFNKSNKSDFNAY